MPHYFCSSCGNVSEAPGACQAPGCSAMGQPLQECDCPDSSSHKKEEAAPAEPTTEETPSNEGGAAM